MCVCLLTGCYQVANTTDLEKAIYFCKGADNIEELLIHSFGHERVKCKNTEVTFLDNVKLP